MIDEIRDYFNAQIRKVDKDLRFDGLIFDNDNAPATAADRTYKIVIKDTTPTRLDVTVSAQINVDVVIYRISGTNRVTDFDQTYCKAIAIYSTIANQLNVSQNDYIKSIQALNITPEAIDSDNSSVRFTIGFQVNTFFNLGE